MKTQNDPALDSQEVETLVLLNGYVAACDSPQGIKFGAGPSTWLALLQAFGQQRADCIAEELNRGGQMTQWRPFGERTMCCDINDRDGEMMCRLYK